MNALLFRLELFLYLAKKRNKKRLLEKLKSFFKDELFEF